MDEKNRVVRIILEDLTGQKFGRLTVIKETRTKLNQRGWLCLCDCGNTTIVPTSRLKFYTRSCGCLHKEKSQQCNYVHGENRSNHRTRLYRCWVNMKSRCYNPNVRSFHDYGLKGIKVCEEWLQFKSFAEWAYTHGYDDTLTIDRVDSSKDYCPDNCRWITLSENSKLAHIKHCWARNLNTDEYYEFYGIRDFASEHGLNYSAIDQVLHGHNKTHKNWIFGYL